MGVGLSSLFGAFDSGYEKKDNFRNAALVGIGALGVYLSPFIVQGRCLNTAFLSSNTGATVVNEDVRRRAIRSQWIFSSFSLLISAGIAVTSEPGPTKTVSVISTTATLGVMLLELLLPKKQQSPQSVFLWSPTLLTNSLGVAPGFETLIYF